MHAFVAQQRIEATGELVLLFRKEFAVFEKSQCRVSVLLLVACDDAPRAVAQGPQ